MSLSSEQTQALATLLNTMKKVRQECPWDQQQTPESITKYAIEEAYELADAIEKGDLTHIKEELGDLLLQVIFHAEMQQEKNHFNFFDIIHTLNEKLVRRHPHVFSDLSASSPDEVKTIWDKVKNEEKTQQIKSEKTSVLSHVKPAPEIKKSIALQQIAANQGFDWPDTNAVWEKIDEEMEELKEAITSGNQQEIENELGDTIFSLLNLARKLNIDPEAALKLTNDKFKYRFKYIEDELTAKGKELADSNLEEMNKLWNEAK